jgi:DGQHR domain-containing protein
MKTELINKGGAQFLRIELQPVKQKGAVFFLGCIPTQHVLHVYTVEPAEYDAKAEASFAGRFADDDELFAYRKEKVRGHSDDKPFQRKESKERINEIASWLSAEEYALFPNTVIATCDLANDYMEEGQPATLDERITQGDLNPGQLTRAYFEDVGSGPVLYLPYLPGVLLVIDGQHRLKGLDAAKEAIKNDYDLLVSFIIGVDRSVVARLFYTINYTQKSVNKSLLYHLSGEFSYELDEITFLHESVKLLNEVKTSPFFGRVKMLGNVPHETESADRRLMTVSQAFLIDYLLPTISDRGSARSLTPPIFLYHFHNEALQIEIVRFVSRYFTAVSHLFGQAWVNPEASLISKTVCLGALIRVMHLYYVKLFIEQLHKDPKAIGEVTVEMMIKSLAGIENVDVSKTGPLSGSSSAGTLNTLRRQFLANMTYFRARDYNAFVSSFSEEYLVPFRAWMAKADK